MNLKTLIAIVITLSSLLNNMRGDITSGLALYMTMNETTGLVAHDSSGT